MLSAFCDAGVEFVVVGAYALAAHGYVRATGDLDLWVGATPENAARVLLALQRFGAPTQGLTVADLATPDVVVQIGVAPRRIDVLTGIDGVDFGEAWTVRMTVDVDGLRVPVLCREHLVQNKRATGRPRDLADLDALGDATGTT